MSTREAGAPFHYDDLMEVVRRRRSVRRFEKGKTVGRDVLLRIAEAGRWGQLSAGATLTKGESLFPRLSDDAPVAG